MNRRQTTTTVCVIIVLIIGFNAALAANNIFFLHHSTGRNLIDEGYVRSTIETHNASRSVDVEFWDHDYNSIGLRNPNGQYVGTDYNIPNDNTDPDGLHYLWTTSNSARETILNDHQIIAFKSCYPASNITSSEMLQQYKDWYLDMRDVFDAHPHRTFVVMTQPPRHRLRTNTSESTRARAFADWLSSSEYLAGHPNVRCYNLYDRMAHPDDGSGQANCLRYAYERSHSDGDSHPNTLANQTVGPEFTQFLLDLADEITPNAAMSWGDVKSTYR